MRKLFLVLGIGIASIAQAHDPPDLLLLAVQFPDTNVPVIDGFDDDWSAIPVDQYGIFAETTYPVGASTREGRALEFASQGEIDPSDMNFRHLLGWSDSQNMFYVTTSVYDDLHVTNRQDPGRFYWDDSYEMGLNADHTNIDDQNSGDVANGFYYKYALPPKDGAFEFFRPNVNLPWLVNGTRYVEIAWSFTGEEFGESTYIYEIRILPIAQMPLSDEATEDQVVVWDFEEGQIIHWGNMVTDVDVLTGDADHRHGQWSTSPGGTAGRPVSDVLLSPIDPGIEWPEPTTAVEAESWGRIKAQYQ